MFLSPTLNKGMTFATFILSGTMPVSNDLLNITVKGFTTCEITYFTMNISMPSKSSDGFPLMLFTICNNSCSSVALRNIDAFG